MLENYFERRAKQDSQIPVLTSSNSTISLFSSRGGPGVAASGMSVSGADNLLHVSPQLGQPSDLNLQSNGALERHQVYLQSLRHKMQINQNQDHFAALQPPLSSAKQTENRSKI